MGSSTDAQGPTRATRGGIVVPPIPILGEETDDKYLYVPDDYDPSVTYVDRPHNQGRTLAGPEMTRFGTQPSTRLYEDRDLFAPATNPDKALKIQQQMVMAGLLKASDVNAGVWDAASVTAYRKVLSFANVYGLRAADALDYYVNNPDLSGLEEAPAAPVFQQTNPLDVQQNYRRASSALTGFEGGANTAGFEQSYLNQERGAFDATQAALQAADEGVPGAVVEKPTPGAAAEDYILKNQRTDVFGHAVASNMLTFFDMLRSS